MPIALNLCVLQKCVLFWFWVLVFLTVYCKQSFFLHLKSKDLFQIFLVKATRSKYVELFVLGKKRRKKKTYSQCCAQAVYHTLTGLGSRKRRPRFFALTMTMNTYIQSLKVIIQKITFWLISLERANFFISTR